MPGFQGLPRRLILGFCELQNLSAAVGAKLEQVGLVNEHGKFSNGIELYARLKERERLYLMSMVQVAHLMRENSRTAGIDLQTLLPQLQSSNALAEPSHGLGTVPDPEQAAEAVSVSSSAGSVADESDVLQAELEALRNELVTTRAELEQERVANKAEIEAIKRLLGETDEQQD